MHLVRLLVSGYTHIDVKKVVWVLIGLLLAVNAVVVIGWRNASSHARQQTHLNSQSKQYPLLAKRIFVENPNDVIINFSPLRKKLNDYFRENVSVDTSFYFEYLPTGTSIRINSTDELVAASLLKLPVVMDLYKADELGRIDMDKPVTIKQEWLDSQYGTLYKKGAGTQITLREAARHTLIESDNTAVNAIQATVSPLLKYDEHAIIELDAPFSVENSSIGRISSQSYASILKCLYFSCYLNETDSQEILGQLAEAPHMDRLGSILADDVKFSHKIGTFAEDTQSDCGIAYAQGRNYIVCVFLTMPQQDSEKYFKDISRMIYEYISNK
jgi:beta-lactamase class A